MIIAAYRAGEISLGKSAELLGVSSAEMQDTLHHAGVLIHLGPETRQELEKEIAEIESA
ncbi:MAG: UPF0175 family protein [Chloroflexi bacterium]|nr:UPF0175 family protein [Chloroflexota bacterium]